MVGGTWTSSGKTSLVELLLRAFPGWAAIKVTPSRVQELCPIGHCCGACKPPEGPYDVILDPEVLAQPGKDTARYLEAGAMKAAWVRALNEALPEALREAIAHMAGAKGVIIESTTAIPLLEGFKILITREGATKLKESARSSAGMIDLLVINGAKEVTSTEPTQEPGFIGLLKPRASIRACAVLPPTDPLNAQFLGLVEQ